MLRGDSLAQMGVVRGTVTGPDGGVARAGEEMGASDQEGALVWSRAKEAVPGGLGHAGGILVVERLVRSPSMVEKHIIWIGGADGGIVHVDPGPFDAESARRGLDRHQRTLRRRFEPMICFSIMAGAHETFHNQYAPEWPRPPGRVSFAHDRTSAPS